MTPSKRKYQTDRTRELSSRELSEYERKLVKLVEEDGFMKLSVQGKNDTRPIFSYTIGLFDTRQIPELITCGLPYSTASAAFDYAAELLTQGTDLTVGRHKQVIGNVEVEFKPVDPKWIKILMLSANWFHGDTSFPALQLIFPDLENRFPGDGGFNTHFDQPMLQYGAPMREIEQELWDAQSPDGRFYRWKFPSSPYTSAYLSKSVDEGIEPITYLSHDVDDGAWQFLGDSMTESGGVAVCLHHPIDKDPSLKELADLPVGWYAEREAPGYPWIRNPKPPEEETS